MDEEYVVDNFVFFQILFPLIRFLDIFLPEVGDTVQRDEQVASIETDKIDVAVNCPESGIISHLFVREGDTVAVGGNLFKITLGPAASPTATKESAAAAPSKQEHLAPAMKSSSGSHGARIPLIKFLGASRKSKGHISQSPASTTSIVEPSAPKKDATLYQDGNRIIYESAEMLPKRYQTRPFSDMEMNLINVSYCLSLHSWIL